MGFAGVSGPDDWGKFDAEGGGGGGGGAGARGTENEAGGGGTSAGAPEEGLVLNVDGGGGGGGGTEPGVFGGKADTSRGAVEPPRVSPVRRELISAKNGSPPGSAGAGGATGADVGGGGGDVGALDDTLVSTSDDGTGGGARGNGGGPGGAPSGGAGGAGGAPIPSSETTDECDAVRKWDSFLGLLGGSFGTFNDDPGSGASGARGGAVGGNGGGNAFGRGGGVEGVCGTEEGTFLRGGGRASGTSGTSSGAEFAVPGTGTRGALGGTIPARLSRTDLSLGIPPAKMSPNCGPAGRCARGAARGADPDAPGTGMAAETDDGFVSRSGFDLSTVTVFLSRMPLWISPKRASRPAGILAGGPGGKSRLGAPMGGGGGGGGGGPAIDIICFCVLSFSIQFFFSKIVVLCLLLFYFYGFSLWTIEDWGG